MIPVYNSTAARAHLKWTPPATTNPQPLSEASLAQQQQQQAPPPYPKTPSSTLPLHTNPATVAPTSPTALFTTLFHTHQLIGIYHAPSSHSDLTLALSATDPRPISYISTHSYSRPHIELRATGSAQSRVLATAEFRHFSSGATLTAASPPPSSPASATSTGSLPVITTQLDKEGVFNVAWALTISIPSLSGSSSGSGSGTSSTIPERFSWRHSSAPEIQRLEGRRRGLEFVRDATDEVLAVYAGVSGWSTRKTGKFRWVGVKGGGTELGEAGELLCVLSLLAVLEKARRARNRGGVEAGAGGAVGGGGGVGGC